MGTKLYYTMLASLMESKLFTFRSASMTVILSEKQKRDTQFRNAIDVRLKEFNKWRMMANMYVIITQNFF